LPPALDATSPAERSTLTAAGQAFTHDESGRQSTSDSASQATDEVAAAGGDPAGEGRARGNPQDGRANLPPQLRAQLGSRSSGEPTLGDGLSSVQRARFVQRVGNAFRMASERGGIVRLRLSPAELGSLRLEITMRDGAMIARMEVETSQARSTIVDNLGMLRQRLAEHNVEIERLDVEVREQGAGETPEQNDRSMAFGHNRRNSSARGNNTDSNNIAQDSQELRVARRPDDNSKLNLVI
jgi:flagellar hook-length control protein FliK